jgi:hypothetical protein
MERSPPSDMYGAPLKLPDAPQGYDKQAFLAGLKEIERILHHRGSTKDMSIIYRDRYYSCTCNKVFVSPTVIFVLDDEYEWKSYLFHLIQDHDYFPSPRFYELVMTRKDSMKTEWETAYPESMFNKLDPQPEIEGYDKERFLDGLERWECIRSAPCGRAKATTFQCPHCEFMCEDPIQYQYGGVRWFWYHMHLFKHHDYMPSKTLYNALVKYGRTTAEREKAAAREAKLDQRWKEKHEKILDMIDELHCGYETEFEVEKNGQKYRVTVNALKSD